MAPTMSYTASPTATTPVCTPSITRGPSSIYPIDPGKNLNKSAVKTKIIILCVLVFVIVLLLATTICFHCGRDRRTCCIRKSPGQPENPLLKIKGGNKEKKKRTCLKKSPVEDHGCSHDEDKESVPFIDKVWGYMRNIWRFPCCGPTAEDPNPRSKPVEQTVTSYGLPTHPLPLPSSPCSVCVQSQVNAVFPREHECPDPIRPQTPSNVNQNSDIPDPHTVEMERLKQIERGLGDLFRTYVTPKKDHITKPEQARFGGLDGCTDAPRSQHQPRLAMLMVRSPDETTKTKNGNGEMKLIIFGLDGVLTDRAAV